MPLQRSRQHKMIAGVCGGLAEWLGWDVTLVRVAYVLASILSVAFPGILVYIILWAVMPRAPPVTRMTHDESISSEGKPCRSTGAATESRASRREPWYPTSTRSSSSTCSASS